MSIFGSSACRKTDSGGNSRVYDDDIWEKWAALDKTLLLPDRPLTEDDWKNVDNKIAEAAAMFNFFGSNTKAHDATYGQLAPYTGYTNLPHSNYVKPRPPVEPEDSLEPQTTMKTILRVAPVHGIAKQFSFWLIKHESVKSAGGLRMRRGRSYPYEHNFYLNFNMEGGTIKKKSLAILFLDDYIFEYNGMRDYSDE